MCRGEGKPLHLEKQALLPIPLPRLTGQEESEGWVKERELAQSFWKAGSEAFTHCDGA